jgi:exopolysaccharide production protein ExoQ
LSSCVGLGQWMDTWNHRFHPNGRLIVALAVLTTLASLIALLATFSRAGVGLVIIAFTIILIAKSGFNTKSLWLWILGAFGLGAIGIVSTQFLGLQFRQVDFMASVVNRLPEWKNAQELFQARPCYGWGVGTFSLAIQPIQLPPTSNFTLISSTPHNAVLLILADTGLIGLIAWGLFGTTLILVSIASFKGGADLPQTKIAIVVAACAIFAQNMVDYSLAVPAVCACLCLLVGMSFSIGINGAKKD